MTTRQEIIARVIAMLEARAVALGAPPDALKAYDARMYLDGFIGAASAFWRDGSRGGFLTRVNTLIKFGLTDAWNAGAAQVGVLPSDMEPEDLAVIAGIISEEKTYVPALLDYLDNLANTPGASLQTAIPRLEMWGNRWNDVYNQALAYFGGKTRLVWVLGPTEHCVTCSGLAGIVAWAKEWEAADIRPQSPRLACHGFRCQCRLVITERRRSPKALDRILNVLLSI